MKIPITLVVVVLVIVGYLMLRSTLGMLRFSAKVITWLVIAAVVAGAYIYYQNSPVDGGPPASGNQESWRSIE